MLIRVPCIYPMERRLALICKPVKFKSMRKINEEWPLEAILFVLLPSLSLHPLTIGLSTFQTQKVLGSKIIRGKIHSFEIIFFSLSYSGWTTLHITLSEAQRQFLKAFQSLVSSVSSVKISLSACTVH